MNSLLLLNPKLNDLKDGYFSLKDVEEVLSGFCKDFPELFLPRESIGKTVENRDITMQCITKKGNNGEINSA